APRRFPGDETFKPDNALVEPCAIGWSRPVGVPHFGHAAGSPANTTPQFVQRIPVRPSLVGTRRTLKGHDVACIVPCRSATTCIVTGLPAVVIVTTHVPAVI